MDAHDTIRYIVRPFESGFDSDFERKKDKGRYADSHLITTVFSTPITHTIVLRIRRIFVIKEMFSKHFQYF